MPTKKPPKKRNDALPKAAPPPLRSLIRYRMTDRNIRSVAALRRALLDCPYAAPVSLPQLHRLVNGEASHVRMDVLSALTIILGCPVGGVAGLFEAATDASSVRKTVVA